MQLKKRQISESLLEMLDTNGKYHEITEIVKTDPYLDMEMRGEDGVILYYRGCKILTITEREDYLIGLDDNYLIGLDDNYLIGLDENYHLKNENDIKPNIDHIFEYICNVKHIVDKYALKLNNFGEKEIQQRVVFENNLSVNADKTEYFIVDIEWGDNNKLGGRADIVAFLWEHTRKSHKEKNIRLTLMEVKQGTAAIETKENNNNPGLQKHYEDYQKLIKDNNFVQDFVNDMLVVLKQKYRLGLIKGLEKLFTNSDPKPDYENIDFVFLLANYHRYSSTLENECKRLPDECKFYTSSFMGYGLYKDFVFTKDKIMNLFPFVFKNACK